MFLTRKSHQFPASVERKMVLIFDYANFVSCFSMGYRKHKHPIPQNQEVSAGQ